MANFIWYIVLFQYNRIIEHGYDQVMSIAFEEILISEILHTLFNSQRLVWKVFTFFV